MPRDDRRRTTTLRRTLAPSAKPDPPRAISLHGNPVVPAAEARLETLVGRVFTALVAAALLWAALGPHKIGDYFAETDFYGDYAKGAGLVQHGHLIPTRYGVVGPVYELTLALVGFLIRDLFLAAKLISVAAAIASLLLWFRLLARRANTRAALLAILFVATNGFFFRYGNSATTDTLANALQAGALCLLLANAGPRAPLTAGLVAALAFLTRYNAIYLLPAGLIAILAGGTPHQRRGRAAWYFVAGFMVPVVPWVIYSLTHGAAFSFQLHHNIAYEVFARARGITWDEYQRTLQPQFHNLWQVIARDPGAVASRMLFNLWDHLRLDARNLLGAPVAVCAALGLLFAAFERGLRRLWPLGCAGLLLFLTLVPAFYSERYSLALLPFYATLAALPFASPRFALALGPAARLWLKPALVLIPLALATQRTVLGETRFFGQLPVEVLPCAATLRDLKQPGDRVIARKPHLSSLAGVDAVPFPFTKTVPELADYARSTKARWLFVSWPEAESRPEYWYLLDTTATVPGLTVRICTPRPAVLYEIGPGFGAVPAWFTNDTLRSMYVARGQLLVDGNNTRALITLGAIERALGHLDRARALFERDAALEPRSVRTLLLLGDVMLSQGDAEAGARIYERALALDPGSLEARVGRGWASLIAGQRTEAARWWRPVAATARDPDTLREMVTLFGALGDHQAQAAAAAALARLGGAR